MSDTKRINFLDMLRVFVILLVIVLHTTATYFAFPSDGWVHSEKSESLLIGLLGFALDSSLLMVVMFFIAGYFAIPSYLKRGTKGFIKDKFLRLGIPYVSGVLLLCPILVCMSNNADGNKMGLIYAYTHFFEKKYFNPYHFWFLGVLLFFFLIAALVFSKCIKRSVLSETKVSRPSFPVLLIFAAVTAILIFTAGCINGAYIKWNYYYIVTFQGAFLPAFIAYFILGMHAYRNSWFKYGYKAKIYPKVIAYVVTFLVHFTIYVITYKAVLNTSSQRLLVAVTYSLVMISWLFMLLSIFARFFNNDKPFCKAVSNSSFSTYIIHLLPVFGILYFTKDISMPLVPKLLIQCIICICASWLAGWIMKKAPGLRKIL